VGVSGFTELTERALHLTKLHRRSSASFFHQDPPSREQHWITIPGVTSALSTTTSVTTVLIGSLFFPISIILCAQVSRITGLVYLHLMTLSCTNILEIPISQALFPFLPSLTEDQTPLSVCSLLSYGSGANSYRYSLLRPSSHLSNPPSSQPPSAMQAALEYFKFAGVPKLSTNHTNLRLTLAPFSVSLPRSVIRKLSYRLKSNSMFKNYAGQFKRSECEINKKGDSKMKDRAVLYCGNFNGAS